MDRSRAPVLSAGALFLFGFANACSTNQDGASDGFDSGTGLSSGTSGGGINHAGGGGTGGLPRASGGASNGGGASTGGRRNAGGAINVGGAGGASPGSGGATNEGGSLSDGGRVGDGGSQSTGGQATGGNQNSGGTLSTGGVTGSGGLPVIQGGTNGYATRFWDCCKPHCGWTGNVPGGTTPVTSCSQSDGSLGGNYNEQSSCNGGGAFMCQDLAPWAVSSELSYGYAATSSGDVCGRCFQLQFTGSSHNGGNDPGSQALYGKSMIVQAINVGSDVSGGQFDILTPGGGVGAFNACANQWGVSASELGAQYGGFLTACQSSSGLNYAAAKSCVAGRCSSVFGSRGLTELQAGCSWFVDWFQAADNPKLVYKEVQCPQALTSKSGMTRR